MILAACFTLRGHGIHIDFNTVVFVSGRQDLPCFLFGFLLRLNKGLTFLQSAFSI